MMQICIIKVLPNATLGSSSKDKESTVRSCILKREFANKHFGFCSFYFKHVISVNRLSQKKP